MPHSAVTQITFQQGGKITLSITVPNWQEGLPIEISGQATQGDETVATFYSVQAMTANGVIEVPDVAAVPPYHFEAGASSPIMVVARATEAWVSTLHMNMTIGPDSNPIYELSEAHWAVAWPGQTQPADWPSQNAQTPLSATLRRHGTWWDRGKDDRLYVVTESRFTRLIAVAGGRESRRRAPRRCARPRCPGRARPGRRRSAANSPGWPR
jgi:hypothetical protein